MNKLHNNKGITILYALLGILIFTMVGIVIFNAATANYTRYKNEKDNQQSYLTVSSAANVFVDSIAGDKVTYKTNNDVFQENSWSYVPYGKPTPKIDDEHDFSDVLMNMVIQRHASSTADIKRTFTIKAKLGDKTLEDINVELSLINYDLIAVFSNTDYYLTATIPFVRDKDSYDPVLEEMHYEGDVQVKTYKIEWDAGNVSILRGKN